MLIIKAFVNDRQIDEIQIQNVGHHSSGKYWNYRLIKPDIPGDMVHCRDKGWEILAVMALDKIVKSKEVSPWETRTCKICGNKFQTPLVLDTENTPLVKASELCMTCWLLWLGD